MEAASTAYALWPFAITSHKDCFRTAKNTPLAEHQKKVKRLNVALTILVLLIGIGTITMATGKFLLTDRLFG